MKERGKNGMKINYQEYHLSKREWCIYIVQGILLCVIVNHLFYQNAVFYLFMIPIPILWVKWRKLDRKNKRKKELGYQFKNALNSLSVSLRAGYSIENSLIEAEKDMRKWNGDSSEIVQELSYINRQIKVSIPAEDLLTDFGIRSDVEDIKNFASVFAIARRMGGNLAEIVQDTAAQLSEKIDAERAIDTAVSAKKFEQMVMSLMPFGMIFYMQLSSPGFFDAIYGTVFGVIFMTACLVLYAAAFWFGRRLVRIEV